VNISKTMQLDTVKKRLTKECGWCGKFLNVEEFYWLSSTKRYHNYCKKCNRERMKMWYQDHKIEAVRKRKQWQDENHELHLEHVKKYRESEKGKNTIKRIREELRKRKNDKKR